MGAAVRTPLSHQQSSNGSACQAQESTCAGHYSHPRNEPQSGNLTQNLDAHIGHRLV